MAWPARLEDIEAARLRLALGDVPPEWAAARVQFIWDGRRRTEYTEAWTAETVADMNDGDVDALIARTMAVIEGVMRERIAEDRAAFRIAREGE